MFAEQPTQRIEVSSGQRRGHRACERLHACQRVADPRIARAIRVEYGVDGAGGDARFAGVDEDRAASERLADGRRDVEAFHGHASLEGEEQCTAIGGGVMILKSAGDTQLLDLGGSAPLGECGRIEGSAAERGQRARERDPRRRGAAKTRAHGKVTADRGRGAGQRRAPERGGDQRRRARVVRGVVRIPGPHGRGGSRIPGDGDVADNTALLAAVWRDIGPAAAEIDPGRGPGDERTRHARGSQDEWSCTMRQRPLTRRMTSDVGPRAVTESRAPTWRDRV